jgi:hypothetical protein
MRPWGIGLVACVLAAPAWAQEPGRGEDERWPPPPAWDFPDDERQEPSDEEPPADPMDQLLLEEPPDAPRTRRPRPLARRWVGPPVDHPPRADEPIRLWPEPIRCRFKLSGHLLPAVEVDQDLRLRDRLRRRRDPDLERGDGFAASIGVGDGDEVASWSIGAFYHLSRHDEDRAGGEAHVHGAYLELQGDVAVPIDSPLRLTLGGAIGLGGIVVDHSRNFHDAGGIAVEARAHVGLRLFEHLEVEAGGGLFAGGGEEEERVRGAFCSLGLTLRF